MFIQDFQEQPAKIFSIENLERYARIKGVNLLGTGDFQHPEWIKELNPLEERDGILYTKTGFPFLWQTEISLMYSQGGKGRRIHYVILSPNKETSEQITKFLGSKGRLDYDGRPIFGFSSVELADEMCKISEDIEIIPAHCLLGEELIHANYSTKKIKDIQKGDLVYTHNNNWKKVKEVLIREYKGEMYKTIPWYFTEGLSTTPEHPFFAIKSHKNCPSTKGLCKKGCSQEKSCARKYYLNYKKEWIQEHAVINVIPIYKNQKPEKRKASEEELKEVQSMLQAKKRSSRKKKQEAAISKESLKNLQKISFRIP